MGRDAVVGWAAGHDACPARSAVTIAASGVPGRPAVAERSPPDELT